MPKQTFVQWPNKCLRRPAVDIDEINDEVREIWESMIEAMDAMPGVGLAAVQLGIPLRLAVVDASNERGRAVRMANPEILHSSIEYREYEEASPNLPGVSANIRRPRAVTVKYLNEQGQVDRKDFVGLWATSVQHQIDHLNGIMYFDHLSKLKRDRLIRRAQKMGR